MEYRGAISSETPTCCCTTMCCVVLCLLIINIEMITCVDGKGRSNDRSDHCRHHHRRRRRIEFFLGRKTTCRLNGLFSSCHVMSSQDMIFFHNIVLFGKNSKASTAYFKGVVRILA